jgi:cytoskeleton protein RodZ
MTEQNHNAITEEAATDAVGPTAGSLLQQAREAAGLTREAVAERLNLLPVQVIALEQNDFKRFPGETFAKGHLRSYARLLKLDCDSVLHAYRGNTSVERRPIPSTPEFQWRPVSLTERTSRWRGYSGLALALAVIVSLWAWQQHRDHSQVLSLTTTTSDSVGGIDSALNSDAESALMDSVQLLPSTPASAPAVTPQTPAANPTGEESAQAAQTEPVGEADKLSLRFSADCWIEIKDRDNRVLVATLKHADEQLQIEGRGPFRVLLGYAPGVVMAYNGTPVKVDVAEGSRSTRLIVGSS